MSKTRTPKGQNKSDPIYLEGFSIFPLGTYFLLCDIEQKS